MDIDHHKYNLVSGFEEKCFIWSSCEYFKKTPAVFKYVPGQLVCSSIEITASGNPLTSIPQRYKKIVLKFKDGHVATAFDVQITNRESSVSGITELTLGALVTYVGKSQVKSQSCTYYSARITISNLIHWLGNSSFDDKYPESLSSIKFIKKTHFDEYIKNSGARIRMVNSCRFHSSIESGSAISEEHIEIIPRQKQEYEWYVSYATKLVQFLSLYTEEPLEITKYVLRIMRSRSKSPRRADPYLSILTEHKVNRNNDGSRFRTYYTKSELENKLVHHLNSWFSVSTGTETAVSIFHDLRHECLPLDVELILLVQAFEAYYSEKADGRRMSKAKFKIVRDTMLATLDNEVDNFEEISYAFKQTLAHANQKSLADKIRNVVQRISPEAIGEIFVYDSDIVIKRIVDTRNHFTHRSKPSNNSSVVSGEELHDCVESLYWIVWFLLLSETKLTDSELSKKIEACYIIKNQHLGPLFPKEWGDIPSE